MAGLSACVEGYRGKAWHGPVARDFKIQTYYIFPATEG